MKRVMWIVLAVLFFCITARAQETPAWEINGGYSYMRANLNGPGSSFHMNGGIASVTENLNDWFGGRLEISAFGGTTGGTSVTAQTFTYGPVGSGLFTGPRIRAHPGRVSSRKNDSGFRGHLRSICANVPSYN